MILNLIDNQNLARRSDSLRSRTSAIQFPFVFCYTPASPANLQRAVEA